ncbi:GNAT family N-acetyltransferase [Roseobacter sp. HKCCD9010]|uniref:GNAT family N-acetyltransferase n=1 Tax=unclassified Roseobacter TaxID=196798 RepID=UPI0014912420|nr:GNAT family N-acetyltransferase [Rhodobacterales bacterium HKCCD4356]NNV11611.1 GNAT family N-acetyltransferase [Roseobacter sp. HKCCD7357]NNV15795.1 GNAT family N-acetyltransferase [Roseobacter sp. HKCCD8768]NNV25255.1 GNAT family N-acetyltransferase [Roseobacter sp. HKCCD8192]NNV29512.1 GNAT family N-acetyltransferase [Roseobacter sp. HKCCD9061]NNV33785.1 GNAT family N-acetyltransferase [Roseobacter sp. HKCCD9073]NNV38035.1 GNAT family N-acetyltransferase [Roseobacter sp. HKCCD9054]NNV4
MTSDISIRPLSSDDKAVWVNLWRDYLAFYDTTLPSEIYDLTFARYTDTTRQDMRAWLGWDTTMAVGLVHAIAHPHGWKAEPVTYLQDLFTTPAARGKGVARALIETVYADADAAGRPSVYWLTQIGNTPARALYDRVATPTDFMKYQRTN